MGVRHCESGRCALTDRVFLRSCCVLCVCTYGGRRRCALGQAGMAVWLGRSGAAKAAGGRSIAGAVRSELSAVGLQLRVRFVPAALLAVLRTALALQPVCF
jgi:hypothetical protein